MSVVLLDANAVIMHGRAFSDRVRGTFEAGTTIVLPRSVEQELVDDVLDNDHAPPNHRASARSIRKLIDDGFLLVRSPDFETYGRLIDEARHCIADDSLPEHLVRASQYILAIVCGLAHENTTEVATADRKLREVVRVFADREGVSDQVHLREPSTVL